MTDIQQPPAGTPTWLKLLLVASLALNLLVLGAGLGAWLSPDGPRGARIDAAVRDVGTTPFLRALAPDDRRAVFRAMRDKAEPLGRNREELRLRFSALLDAIAAEPFDPSEVASLLQLQRSAAITRQEIGEAALLEHLARMSARDRAAFADRLEQAMRNGRDRGGRTSD